MNGVPQLLQLRGLGARRHSGGTAPDSGEDLRPPLPIEIPLEVASTRSEGSKVAGDSDELTAARWSSGLERLEHAAQRRDPRRLVAVHSGHTEDGGSRLAAAVAPDDPFRWTHAVRSSCVQAAVSCLWYGCSNTIASIWEFRPIWGDRVSVARGAGPPLYCHGA